MKIEIYKCDVCKKEIPFAEVINQKMSVIFLTEQDEGRATKEPYLENVQIDLCNNCKTRILNEEILFGWGAMGYNEYGFTKYNR